MKSLRIGKVTLHGSSRDIELAANALNTVVLSGYPPADRLILQELIIKYKIKAAILYDGSTVWDYTRLVKDVRLIAKSKDMTKMTNYLYKFLTLACGSIAHYNKFGWIECYPTVEHLRNFFRRNEFGQSVYSYTPNPDTRHTVSAINAILGV